MLTPCPRSFVWLAATAATVPATAGTMFTFNLGNAPELSNDAAALEGLERAASFVESYFTAYDADIELDVITTNQPNSGALASAGSVRSPGLPGNVSRGFVGTEILSGVDQNGTASDGTLSINLGANFSFDAEVGPQEFDFAAIVAHELFHTVGFASTINSQGGDLFGNTLGQPSAFSPFDQGIGDLSGPVIDPETNAIDVDRFAAAATGLSLIHI